MLSMPPAMMKSALPAASASAPMITVCMPDPHTLFTVVAWTDLGSPALIAACRAVNLSVPLVVRMKGTNEDLGKQMLGASGLPIISADTMAEAATKIVAAVK